MNLKQIFENIQVKAGRPRMYETEEDLREAILDYFENGATEKTLWSNGMSYKVKVLTITGLSLHLGFSSRGTLYEYEKSGEFKDTIKAARTFIEKEYEEQLQNGSATGAIFALKNFGWKDIQTLEGEVNDNGNKKFKMEYVHSKYENIDEEGEVVQENK